MNKQKILYFEEIDLDLEDLFITETTVEDQIISISIDLTKVESKETCLRYYEKYIEKLTDFKVKIDRAITKNFKEEGAVLEYIEHHLEEFDNITLENLLKYTDPEKEKTEQLLSVLKLISLSFRFTEEEFAVWDYTFGHDITNYRIAVYTDKNGKPLSFGFES